MIQPMNTITVDQSQIIQMAANNAQQDGAPNAFVVTADGNLATDQNVSKCSSKNLLITIEPYKIFMPFLEWN